MISIGRIRVPSVLIILLTSCAFLFSPFCPVGVHKSEWKTPCMPPLDCAEHSEYSEVHPALLVLANGFEWKASSGTSQAGIEYEYSSNPGLVLLILPGPIVAMLLILLLKQRVSKDGELAWTFVVLPRRPWRSFLWITGFGFLSLSAFWAWRYLLFYGESNAVAFIDPLLTSTISTFVLSGTGFAIMMLAVRSRAIWPDKGGEAGG